MTPINLRLFLWTVLYYLWQFCHNLLCPTVTFGLILYPCSRVSKPHTNMFYDWICPLTDENITFSKTPAVYEDPCLLQDPFGLRRSLPSPRPFRSTKILAFSETPSVYEDPVPVPEILRTWSFSPSVRQPFLYYYFKIQPDRTSADIS